MTENRMDLQKKSIRPSNS